ncbi:Protein CBG11191 [Caenorhabditis briggsae]|uniref:Mucosa-associated lymphoid tissue lymphoma translocation protein 1 n=2 Tax=Caenorhabditis briggsae TaxID=6238 RepID=A0AAE9DIY5_CAEBR|nr:Protein CBG11191 [Caenorhabditis briggsae]ULU05058.1 hypothetical protein L3Y34_017650 [Caenorhabditis briggsae]UMM17034.1 hypothetical protein L5515_013788 [Caenorhabditis briggsae]CAP30386.2 Protein CBG11191 [Caenorhabditis briggsae]
MNTNLADLPVRIFRVLSQELEKDNLWTKIVDYDQDPIFSMKQLEIDSFLKRENCCDQVLRRWGNRGQTVGDLLARLQYLSRTYEDEFDTIQFQLRRKFKALRWVPYLDEPVTISFDGDFIKLECKAQGFPTPQIKWYTNDSKDPIHTGRSYTLLRCKCSTEHQYKCIAINQVPEGLSYSEHYRRHGKQWHSRIESEFIDVTSCVRDDELCESCKNLEMGRLSQILAEEEKIETNSVPIRPNLDVNLRAADKVALVMSNCSYKHLPELMTPHCDAQTLADALQKMNYKTVTLADLTLDEMRYFIREYKKLIGDGVYAVFYFVGHGFEVNGQCYLLGVDAPADAHQPQHALSMDWLLSIFRDKQPSLNLLLLDVCRKFIPYEAIGPFVEYSEQFKKFHRAHRNMVYGYSTSGGVGAYEVKGEVNGIFMKYLKNHVQLEISVIDMLNKVLLDIGDDQKVCDLQVPEIRSTLTHPRSLADPLIFDGHTASFDNHTLHWRLMHELPNPATIRFDLQPLVATVWFQFCGNFTNKVYVLASVADYRPNQEETELEETEEVSENALNHRAFVVFPKELHCSEAKEYSDDEEGVSLYWILSGLQKIKKENGLSCEVHLRHVDDLKKTIEKKSVDIGHILITRIKCLQ